MQDSNMVPVILPLGRDDEAVEVVEEGLLAPRTQPAANTRSPAGRTSASSGPRPATTGAAAELGAGERGEQRATPLSIPSRPR